MKKVFFCLLAICSLSHRDILAMDPLEQKVDEATPLIQSSPTVLQQRMLNYARYVNDGLSSFHSKPKGQFLFLWAISRALSHANNNILTSKKKAPYYHNLPELIEYLVGVNSKAPLKEKWKKHLNDYYKAFEALQSGDNEHKELVDIICGDTSSDKTKAINAYYEVIERILNKTTF